MSDHSSHLSPHFDALTPDSVGDSVDMIDLSGEQYLEILDTFSPRVRSRVEFLIELQKQHDKVQAKYFEERSKLEARYLKLYEPIYKKRHDVVNGLLEVEATDEADREEKGIPNFWLTAMKTNDTLAELITEADEGPLEYLRDIKWCRVEASKSFKLKFFFHPNPYFRNTVLAKTYHMIDEDEPMEATG
ncbi:nucleosome assembly protein 1;4-like [Phaseolus vulgaris]|uniref:nucleosome assembly protein 1;4-like n=1 Tax=Phaseolus vulgaris TaxID=3885 RepID=UPI0035CC8211